MNPKNKLKHLINSGILAQSITLIGSLLLSRIYTPDAFGNLAFYTGITSITSIVSGLRFDFIALGKNDKINNYYSSAILINASIHALALIGLLLLTYTDTLTLSHTLWITALSLITGTFNIATQWLISQKDYKRFSNYRNTQAILFIVTSVAFSFLDSKNGILYGFASSQLVISLLAINLYTTKTKKIKLFDITECISENLKPALKNTFLVLLQYSTPFAPILIGNQFYEKTDIGAYFIFSAAIAAPLSIFRRSLLVYLNGEATNQGKLLEISRANKKAITTIIGTFTITLILALTVSIYFDGFQKTIINIIFGMHWSSHSNLLAPIILYFLIDAVLQPFTTILPLWGITKTSILLEASRFLLVFALLPLISIELKLNFIEMLITYFFFMAAIYSLTLVFIYYKTKEYAKERLHNP